MNVLGNIGITHLTILLPASVLRGAAVPPRRGRGGEARRSLLPGCLPGGIGLQRTNARRYYADLDWDWAGDRRMRVVGYTPGGASFGCYEEEFTDLA